MISPTQKSPRSWPKLPSLMSIGALAALSLACGGGGAGSSPNSSTLTGESSNTGREAVKNLPSSIVPDSLVSLQKAQTQQKASAHPRSKTLSAAETTTEDEIQEDDFESYSQSGAFQELQYMLDRISYHRGELAIQYVVLDSVLPEIRQACGNAMTCDIPEGTFNVTLESSLVEAIVSLGQGDDTVILNPGEDVAVPALTYTKLSSGEYDECVELHVSADEDIKISWSADRQKLRMVDTFKEDGFEGTVTYINDANSGTFTLMEDILEGEQRWVENLLIKETGDVTTFESSHTGEGQESYQVSSSGNITANGGELISTFAWEEFPLYVSANVTEPFFLLDGSIEEGYYVGYHDGLEGSFWGDPTKLDQLNAFIDDEAGTTPLDIPAGSLALGELATNVEQVRESFDGDGEVKEVAFRQGTEGTWEVDESSSFEEDWEPEELYKGAELSDSSFLNVNNLAVIVRGGTQVDSESIWDEAIGIAFAVPNAQDAQNPEVFVNVWASDSALEGADVYLLEFSEDQMTMSLKSDITVTPSLSQSNDDGYWEGEDDFDDMDDLGDFEGADDLDDMDDLGDSEGTDDLDDMEQPNETDAEESDEEETITPVDTE